MTTRQDKPGSGRARISDAAARAATTARAGRAAPTPATTLRAVAAAVMTLGAGQAMANGYCPSYTIANGDVESVTCVLDPGAALDVQAGGIIAPASTGVLVPVAITAASITNAGTITSGTRSAILVEGSISGGITNSGTIVGEGTGHHGIFLNAGTVAGGITNAGSIGGHTSGIRLEAGSIVDRITNSGSISGIHAIKLDASTITGGITNAGTIVGTNVGILVGANSTIAGDIVNSGSLGGGSEGIYVSASTLAGSITNSGTLTGFYGGVSLTSSTMSGGITNSGLIGGGTSDARGMLISDSTMSGGITNSGTISGGTSGGVAIKIASSTISGGIANSGTISGPSMAFQIESSTVDGGITNSGTIVSSSSGGQALSIDGSTITGGITNSGRIIADASTGLAININGSTVSGGIRNSGSIISTSSGGQAIAIASSTITGGISNSGTIHGSFRGMYVAGSSSIAGGLTNSGSIGGDTQGITIKASTLSGGITNSGTISGYAGAMIVESGSTIDGGITNSGAIRGGASSGNAINFSFSTVSGSFTNSGSIRGGSNGIRVSSSTITGSITNAGSISGGSNGIKVVSGTVSGGITNSGTISSPGLAINVDAGSSVPVIHNRAGGLIDGAMSILDPATNVTNAGTIAIPASASSTIAGNYTQESTGVLRTRVLNDTTYGSLSVSGVATLPSNAKIDVDVSNPSHPFTVTGMADVIRAGTLVSDGTFAVTDNSALFNFTAVKDGNTVDLVLSPAGASGVQDAVLANRNTPANGAALALDQIIGSNPNGPLAQLFVGLTNRQQINGAATQVMPLLTGGSLQAGGAAYSGINQTIQARVGNNLGMPSGDMFLGDRNFWLKPFGSWADQGDRQGVIGYKANVTGVATGFDGMLNRDLRVGAAFAYANAGVDGKSSVAPHRLDADVYQFIGYGSYSLDANTHIDFQGDIGMNRNRGARTITFAPSVAYSSFDSLALHAGIGLSRRYAKGANTQYIPSLRLDYTTVKEDAYSETGAGVLNLNVEGRRVEQLIAGADARVVHALSDRTTLSANAGLGYDLFAERIAINSSFAGAPGVAFTTYGADPRPWVLRGGAGLTYRTRIGMDVTVRYDLEQRAEYLNQTASARLRWLF